MAVNKSHFLNLGFVLEHSLGHITHAQNLKRALKDRPDIWPTYIDVPFHNTPGTWSKFPGVRSNWSLRASLCAYLALRPQSQALQAVLFHTQVTSLFSAGLMRRLPAVISLDATPLQYDALGRFYGHSPSAHSHIEGIKKRLNVRALTAARHIITWSAWTKTSLVADYGMSADKITVIPPGIDTIQWRFPREIAHCNQPLHLLFVGGDFVRKGGDVLLEAFQRLAPSINAVLHLVTNSTDVVEGRNNVCVYRNIAPNSEKLLQLFRQADIFVFPTRADCLPLAIMEALAAGLPIITTRVGALSEAVVHGETGLIVPPNDPEALTNAINQLAADPGMRARLGSHARVAALERFDATTNYRRLLNIVTSIAR